MERIVSLSCELTGNDIIYIIKEPNLKITMSSLHI